MSDLQNLGKFDEYNDEISFLINSIEHLFENSLNNIDLEGMDKIHSETQLVISQCLFWIDAEEASRVVYDLRTFASWLLSYIADKE